MKLFAEAREYLAEQGRKEPLFAGVCVNIEEFTDEESRKALVNTYSRNPADGYLFYVDPIQERPSVPAQVYSYLNMLLDFKELGRPVIAGRIGSLGLGVVALGVDAFEVGIASLTFFTEKDLLEDRPVGYAMKTRYYMPQLLTSLQIETATDILAAPAYRRLACGCPFCGGRSDGSLAQRAKEHFLYHRSRELDAVNALPEADRMASFLQAAESAHRTMGDIRRRLGIQVPPFQHLKVWLEVFPEVAKRVSGTTRTM